MQDNGDQMFGWQSVWYPTQTTTLNCSIPRDVYIYVIVNAVRYGLTMIEQLYYFTKLPDHKCHKLQSIQAQKWSHSIFVLTFIYFIYYTIDFITYRHWTWLKNRKHNFCHLLLGGGYWQNVN